MATEGARMCTKCHFLPCVVPLVPIPVAIASAHRRTSCYDYRRMSEFYLFSCFQLRNPSVQSEEIFADEQQDENSSYSHCTYLLTIYFHDTPVMITMR